MMIGGLSPCRILGNLHTKFCRIDEGFKITYEEEFWMKVAVLSEKCKIRITKIEKPIPDSGEVLIRTKAVGICGTDLSIYRGEWPVKLPMIMGHEAAGIITKLGGSVSTFDKGERVVVDPGLTCGKCWFCKRGSYYQCENIKYIGIDAGKGAFAEYFTAPATKCYGLPQNIYSASQTQGSPKGNSYRYAFRTIIFRRKTGSRCCN